MDTVRVIHDREGQTLTVWFGDPMRETVASTDDDGGVVIMKDADGRAIGVEVLGYTGRPERVALERLEPPTTT
jgi:hypothetical protein